MEKRKQDLKAKDKYFEFHLMDYSAPPFISATKSYFGTIDDFRPLIVDSPIRQHEEIKNAFNHLVQGKSIQYYAGQIKIKFAERISILERQDIFFGELTYKHENTWDCPYIINMDEANVERLLIRRKKGFVVAYKARLLNPCVVTEGLPDMKLNGGFWGFPNMIRVEEFESKEFNLKSSLFFFEKQFNDLDQARIYFSTNKDIHLKEFFDDVFGDG